MKIAILTSGGDSPGMNSLLTNLIHFGLKNNHELYLINDGYYGLTNSKFLEIKDDIEKKPWCSYIISNLFFANGLE